MKKGYTQIIENDQLSIFYKDKIIATGKYCDSTGLIKMDELIHESNKVSKLICLDEWHRRFGHVGLDIIKSTLKQNNFPITGTISHCDSCNRAKMKKSSSKSSPSIVSAPLEIIESDTKTFSITSYDNFNKQIKFIDCFTGFIYLEFVPDLKAVTILEVFRKFKEIMENASNYHIKKVRTDDNLSYKGIFYEFLQANGIVKQTGQRYRKHVPPRVERSHQTISNLSRAMLI